MTFVIEMKNIEKSFGPNKVLKGVNFNVNRGSIHALLGENGTGKTTLMNILSGLLTKDGGTIIMDGQEITDGSNDIAFIHQELSLINDLSVYENLYLGRELRKMGILDKKTMRQRTRALIDELGIQLDENDKVENLNPALKQITEILRSLLQDAKVIIMDEPTTSLTDVEIHHLFEVMRRLKSQGVSLIFISHKLNEVVEICDAYTIMRDGQVVETGAMTEEITESHLSNQMVGRTLAIDNFYKERSMGEVIFELENLSKEREFQNVNLNLKKGEVLGVTGLLGDGRSELFLSVVGANSHDSGVVKIEGYPVQIKTTADALKLGISYVPKNRKENGIVKDLTIAENLTIPVMSTTSVLGRLNKSLLSKSVKEYREDLTIKMQDESDSILSLSGGNQQKVLLARALVSNPKIVILDNPTQGVDIGAKFEIYTLIHKLAEQGISFIILSSEFPEIEKLCDRVYVMFEGNIKYEFSREKLNENDVMLVATGGRINE